MAEVDLLPKHGTAGNHSQFLGWIFASRANLAMNMGLTEIVHTVWGGYLFPEQIQQWAWDCRKLSTLSGVDICFRRRSSNGHGTGGKIHTVWGGYLLPEQIRQWAWDWRKTSTLSGVDICFQSKSGNEHGTARNHPHCLGWIFASRANLAMNMGLPEIVHTVWGGYLLPEQI